MVVDCECVFGVLKVETLLHPQEVPKIRRLTSNQIDQLNQKMPPLPIKPILAYWDIRGVSRRGVLHLQVTFFRTVIVQSGRGGSEGTRSPV